MTEEKKKQIHIELLRILTDRKSVLTKTREIEDVIAREVERVLWLSQWKGEPMYG
jgi:hypothetical protein